MPKDWDCSTHLFPRTRDLKHLQVSWESQPHLPSPALAPQVPPHLLLLTCPSLPALPSPLPQLPLSQPRGLCLSPDPASPPSVPPPVPLTCPPHLSLHLPPSPAPLTCPLTWSLSLAALTCLLSLPQVWERPVALEAELALTLTVLEAMANSSLGHSLEQPLLTLQNIHSKLQACVSVGAPGRVWALTAWTSPLVPGSASQPHPSLLCPQVPAQPTASSRPRGRLHHWLHRLQEARKVSEQRWQTVVRGSWDPRRGRY